MAVPDSCPHRFYYHSLPTTGRDLYHGLMNLAQHHYNLSSTLVQDIPMKEEANTSGNSAMYGVELIHAEEAHAHLRQVGLDERLMLRSDPGDTEKGDSNSGSGQPRFSRPNSGFSRTLGIKWVTPKLSDAGEWDCSLPSALVLL